MLGSPGLESLLVRLYLDRHIMARLAIDLRGRGFDVLRTEEAGNDTAPDEEQLAFSTAANRTILTFNTRDFASLHEQWLGTARPHAGIIVSGQLGSREYGTLLRRMLRLLNRFTAEEMVLRHAAPPPRPRQAQVARRHARVVKSRHADRDA